MILGGPDEHVSCASFSSQLPLKQRVSPSIDFISCMRFDPVQGTRSNRRMGSDTRAPLKSMQGHHAGIPKLSLRDSAATLSDASSFRETLSHQKKMDVESTHSVRARDFTESDAGDTGTVFLPSTCNSRLSFSSDSDNSSIMASDTLENYTPSIAHFYREQQQIHSIDETSPDYPDYLKKASVKPLKFPPRKEWVPLHPPPTKWQTFIANIKGQSEPDTKQGHQNISQVSQKPPKTSWTLPGMEIVRVFSARFSFKRRDKDDVRKDLHKASAHQRHNDHRYEEDDSDVDSRQSLAMERQSHPKAKPHLNFIQYSNTYVRGDGDNWIFLHRDYRGNVLGKYQIQGSFI